MMHIEYLALAFLEGLTEFLPISSTAHLILTGKILAIDLADPYVKFYLLFIQLGALCAGVLLFTKGLHASTGGNGKGRKEYFVAP